MMKNRLNGILRTFILGDVDPGFFESAEELLYETNHHTVRVGYVVSLVVALAALVSAQSVPQLASSLSLTLALTAFYVIAIVLVMLVVPHAHRLLRVFYLVLVVVPLLVLLIAGFTTRSGVFITLFFMVLMSVPFLYIERPGYTLGLCLLLLGTLIAAMILLPGRFPVSLGAVSSECAICFCILCAITASMRNLALRNLEAEHSYRAEAARDPLTGLLNHSSSEARASHYLGDPPHDVSCAFLVIDIDDFKAVNDTMGHYQGDRVLQATASVLTGLFRQCDIIGRFGGDEFTVLMKDVGDLDVVCRKADQLNESLGGLFADEMVGHVSCSIGIALDFHQKLTYKVLFIAADRALYRAKRSGKGRYAVSTEPVALEERPLLLIVDDAEVSRLILTSCLGKDYDTLEASDGQQALGLLEQYGSRVRCVLLDIEMPILDGRETLRRMASDENLKDIPVMVVTAHGREEDELRALGAVGFFEKPFDPRAVRESVASMVKVPSA